MSRIEINQLTKQFEHITALDGVTLNLSEKDQKWLGIKDTFKFEYGKGY